jgi:carbon monoxide dehydrogenase subunit G
MDMTGERRISAPRQTVWEALNDPAVLKHSIPGCESLEKVSESEFKATANVKIGPISARFSGRVELTDIDPPNGYRIGGEGQGGVAGFAKGGATVALTEDGTDTLLHYDVKAQVGGKIAQLGARLIDASAKQMADQFFNRFAAQVSGPEATAAPPTDIASPVDPGAVKPFPVAEPASISIFSLIPAEIAGYPIIFWVGSVIFLLVFILIFSAYL